ncbi:ABC transporter permease [Halapricum salinum]|uniref:ABC transporter permease n=1 Tax=Halapricum salinum TaxID=1457250 RepID=A0A4D6HB62_9EURY|nr:ABC transporter permease [Halapricum salinum]QCC50398.1 ABC transporter permease [Halapricum salinum]
MSNSLSSDPDGEVASDAEAEMRSLRARVRANPAPALVWVVGALVLVALEFGRILDGVLKLGVGLNFLFDGITTIPRWIEGNVAGFFSGETLSLVAGSLAHDLVGLLLLYLVAFFLRDYSPIGLDDLFEHDLSRRAQLYAERFILTGVLAVLAAVLLYTPVGGIVDQEVGAWVSVVGALSDLPTMTSREVIPNLGHQTQSGGWDGTFLGLEPKWAWAIRFALVWIYAFACFVWAWKGYNVYRNHYRELDWTPRDDTVRRFRNHYWGLFGLFVVFGFVVLALFAPAVSPVGAQEHIYEPNNHEFQHFDEESGEVVTVKHFEANLFSQSDNEQTIGPWSYDNYDRWMPLGTTPSGQSMLTHLAFGARTSLVIALSAVGIGVAVAVTLSLLTAYYKGLIDVVVIFLSDTIISIPALVLVMLILVVFQDSGHWLAEPMDGGLLLAIVLGFAYWPGMWRSIRGPSLQVAEEEWVDAAKTYGQTPRNIMRKHMAPYIMSYIMIYASLLLGGIIITVAALSFLGLGIAQPTPEWGRLINEGRSFIGGDSVHISTISGIMIALVVLGFNALGDGIRDAVDPEADIGDGATAGGGGG